MSLGENLVELSCIYEHNAPVTSKLVEMRQPKLIQPNVQHLTIKIFHDS